MAAMMRRSSQFIWQLLAPGRRACNIAATCCNIPAYWQRSTELACSRRPPPERREQTETTMLQLYFFPMACSLASRIALMEAGIEARYHLVNIWTKKLIENDSDFRAISPK